jgi:hypothetical protein
MVLLVVVAQTVVAALIQLQLHRKVLLVALIHSVVLVALADTQAVVVVEWVRLEQTLLLVLAVLVVLA